MSGLKFKTHFLFLFGLGLFLSVKVFAKGENCFLNTGIRHKFQVLSLEECIEAAKSKLGTKELHVYYRSWSQGMPLMNERIRYEKNELIGEVKYEYRDETGKKTKGSVKDPEILKIIHKTGSCLVAGWSGHLNSGCVLASESLCDSFGGIFSERECINPSF